MADDNDIRPMYFPMLQSCVHVKLRFPEAKKLHKLISIDFNWFWCISMYLATVGDSSHVREIQPSVLCHRQWVCRVRSTTCPQQITFIHLLVDGVWGCPLQQAWKQETSPPLGGWKTSWWMVASLFPATIAYSSVCLTLFVGSFW